MQNNQKDLSLAILYFLLALVITIVFIGEKYDVYENGRQMVLSGVIAGGKWVLQLLAIFLFIGRKKYEFMRRIGFACMVGSIMLLTVFIFNHLSIPNYLKFILPLAASVMVMIFLYYKAVKQSGLGLSSFFGWLASLTLAIFLQLTVVFHIIF